MRTSTAMTTQPEFRELVPLGDGPTATVLAGVHAATGEAVALKVLRGKLDRRTRARLRTELAQLAPLRAQAPVLVADELTDLGDGRWALRMELCAQSLPELLGAFGPLTVPDTLALGAALAEALAAAHRAGVVHGGVTPGNVLFRPSGEPVLADFGRTLRRAFPRDPASQLDFLPPETVRDGTTDERSDLYGLGVILYLALTGRSPHQGPPGEAAGERLLRVLGTPPPPLDRADLPPELTTLVTALLAKDPAARPSDASVVAAQLAALHEAAAPAEAPGSAAEPAADPVSPAASDEPVVAPVAAAEPETAATSADSGSSAAEPAGPERAEAEPAEPAPTEPKASSGGATGPDAPGAAARPAFDDFAETDDASTDGGTPAAPRPRGGPILVFGSIEPPRRTSRTPFVLAGASAVALFAVVAVLLLLNRPGELAVPPAPAPVVAASASPTSARVVQLELTDPVDRGNSVELSWRSTEPLHFAVIVAAEGEPEKAYIVREATSYRVPVDPVRKYCFLIQGTDSVQVYESPPKPIRGARCVK